MCIKLYKIQSGSKVLGKLYNPMKNKVISVQECVLDINESLLRVF